MTTQLPDKYYTYIFVRQDISPEQQAVQAAHATFKLGVEAMRRGDKEVAKDKVPYQLPAEIRPNQTYFTLIGVRNLDALLAAKDILEKFGFMHQTFFEDDLGGEPTAIACHPIREDHRGPLLAFNLLKMK
jgi:hypothetical protein